MWPAYICPCHSPIKILPMATPYPGVQILQTLSFDQTHIVPLSAADTLVFFQWLQLTELFHGSGPFLYLECSFLYSTSGWLLFILASWAHLSLCYSCLSWLNLKWDPLPPIRYLLMASSTLFFMVHWLPATGLNRVFSLEHWLLGLAWKIPY